MVLGVSRLVVGAYRYKSPVKKLCDFYFMRKRIESLSAVGRTISVRGRGGGQPGAHKNREACPVGYKVPVGS
jgi:hypothetical protein